MGAREVVEAQAILGSCPFSFEVDGSGRLVRLGRYFETRHPDLKGRLLLDAFRPLQGEDAVRELLAGSRRERAFMQRIELELTGGGISIVGTFLPLATPEEGAVFLGTISPQLISRVTEFGLTMDDFAPFDIAPDFAMMAQVNAAVLQDARLLNERLAAAHDAAVGAHKTIEAFALLDALSGLANRAAFQQALERSAATPEAALTRSTTMLVLDIDGFKPVNDRYGHAAGDQLIRSIGKRIADATEGSAKAYRIGGDEFAILFRSETASDARRRAGEIMHAIQRPYCVEGRQIHVGSSGGLARGTGGDLESLYHAADIALYEAKRTPKRKLQVFCEEMGWRELEGMLLERDLIGAIERRELEVFVQPQFDVESGRLVGGEALARWWNPRLDRYVPPSDFIPIAEKLGRVIDIDLMVLETITREQRASPGCAWSTNLSPLSLGEGLPARIEAIMAAHGPLRAPLEIEITESAVLSGGAKLVAMLRAIRAMGIGIAIDDFGAGQTSLSHLARIPITRLKVDRSLVKAIDRNRRAHIITRSVIGLARELGLRVTAEGVERVTQDRMLRAVAPLAVQGFLYAQPMPLSEFRLLLGPERSPRLAASM